MVSPSTALKAQSTLGMMFWMGMTAFPEALMPGHRGSFDCPKAARGAAPCSVTNQKVVLFNMFSLFGIQNLFWSSISAALARDAVSSKTQSVACFSSLCIWIFLFVNDLVMLFDPEEMGISFLPKEAQYGASLQLRGNLVMWAGFGALLYSAWKESGSVMPSTDVKTLLLPSGQFGTALTVFIVNCLLWGVPMCLLRQPMLDGFARGFMDGFSPLIKKMVFLMMGQAGKMMVCNALNMAAIASVGDEDANYRMLRATSLGYMFYMGSFAKDVLVEMQLDGYENQGRAIMWFLNLAVCFYTMDAWAKASFTLKKTK